MCITVRPTEVPDLSSLLLSRTQSSYQSITLPSLSNDPFAEENCSDVCVKVFNREYHLHKEYLSKSPFFDALFRWPGNGYVDEQTETYPIELDDPFITQKSFELTIERLYGLTNRIEEKRCLAGMLAASQYFSINDITNSVLDYIKSNLTIHDVPKLFEISIDRDGLVYKKVLSVCKFYLLTKGYKHQVACWDGVPVSLILEVVSSDIFLIPNEYYRALFVMKLIERRQQDYDLDCADILRESLNTSVHYSTISFEGLKELRQYRDFFGKPYIDPELLDSLIWNDLGTIEEQIRAKGFIGNVELTIQNQTNMFDVPAHNSLIKSSMLECSSHPAFVRISYLPPLRATVSFRDIKHIDPYTYRKVFQYAGSYWTIQLENKWNTERLHIIRNQSDCHEQAPTNTTFTDPNASKAERPNTNTSSHIFQLDGYNDAHSMLQLSDRQGPISMYFKFYVVSNSNDCCFLEKHLAPFDYDSCYSDCNTSYRFNQGKIHSCGYSFDLSQLLTENGDSNNLSMVMVMGVA